MAKRSDPRQLWNEIASFYAGRPMTVAFPETKYGAKWGSGGWGGTTRGSEVILGPFQRKMLEQMLAPPKRQKGVKPPTFGQGTMAGLATLIHEAIHARAPQPGTGFRDWMDESQAGALGSELVPDALQRFFGIKVGSKLSRKLEREAKSLSNYQMAYQR